MAYFNRGVVKYHLNDYEGAIYDYTKSIEVNINDADSYLNRGLIYFEIGNDKFGCKDFKKAASLGNKFSVSWLNSEKGKWCLSSNSDVKSVFLFD